MTLRPQPGGFYRLRAGLTACVIEPFDISFTAHGGRHVSRWWRGLLVDGAAGPILWYHDGNYSPVRGATHELDIVAELT